MIGSPLKSLCHRLKACGPTQERFCSPNEKLCLCVQDFNTKYMAATMAVVLIIGPYFSGHLRPEATLMGRASMLSNMRYHTAVIISLFSACGSLASSSRKFMKLTAYAERLQQLEDVAREISSGAIGCSPQHSSS